MSTTNPPAGPNNPGGDAPRPQGGPRPGAGPQWPADAGRGAAPDDHGGGGGVNPAAVAAGHEPDAFYVKPIMSIPLAVVVTFVIAFTVAAGAFAYLMNAGKPDPYAHPDAVARGQESLDTRLQRIERAGLEKNKLREVDQPRLEPLRRLEADGQVTTRPPLPTGNSPEIHPEQIMPDRVAALQRTGYADKDKKFARIPIADAMKLAAGNKEMFPVRKDAAKLGGTAVRPSASSGGQGVVPPAPKVEAKDADAGKKKDADTPETPKAPAPKPKTDSQEKK